MSEMAETNCDDGLIAQMASDGKECVCVVLDCSSVRLKLQLLKAIRWLLVSCMLVIHDSGMDSFWGDENCCLRTRWTDVWSEYAS